MRSHPSGSAFVRQSSRFLATQLATACLSLVATVGLARALAPAEQGQLTVATAWFWLVLLGCGLGTPTVLGRAWADNKLGTRQQSCQLVRLSVGLGGLAGATLLLTSQPHGAALAAAALPALGVQLLSAAALGRGSLRPYRLLQWLPALGMATASLAAWGLHRPAWAWWSLAGAQAVAACGGAVWLCGEGAQAACGRRSQVAVRWWRQDLWLLRQGLPVVAAGLLVTLGLRGDVLLLSYSLPWPAIACYGVAKQVSERLGIVAQATGPLAFAMAAQAQVQAGQTPLACRLTWLLSALGAAVLAAAAPLAIPLFFGASYAQAVPLTWLLLGGSACANVGQVAASHLLAQGRAAAVLRCSAVGFGVNLLAMGLWVPRWGIAGAAAASSVAAACEAVAKTCTLARVHQIPMRALWRPQLGDATMLAALPGFSRRPQAGAL